jgi:hypothetical protein
MLSSFTNDPVRDAERYYEELEEKFDRENRRKRCAVCRKACGRLKYYDFDGVIVCDDCLYEAFRREIIPEEILDDMAEGFEVRNG